VFAGDAFTVDQRRGIDRAIKDAQTKSGLAFCVRIGGLTDGDAAAEARSLMHRMPDPARSLVVLVDPREHAIEIVTGSSARQTLPDEECHAAAVAMQGSFRAGDLPGGIISGIQDLGERAERSAGRPGPTEITAAPRHAEDSGPSGAYTR